MEISYGVIITNGERVLVCHPTDSPWTRSWSLPKGLAEADETPQQAAIRETEEETGIKLLESKLVDCGVFEYRPEKKLHIFLHEVVDVNVANLKCTSTFEALNGKIKLEIDKFAWIKFEKAVEYLNPRLYKIFKEIMQ